MKSTTIAQGTESRLEKHLTPAETGAIIRIHPESVRRGIRQGRIRAQRVGNKLIIADGATFEGNCQMLKSDGQVLELNPQILSDGDENHHKNLKVIGNKR